jgi:hypothetical protein
MVVVGEMYVDPKSYPVYSEAEAALQELGDGVRVTNDVPWACKVALRGKGQESTVWILIEEATIQIR